MNTAVQGPGRRAPVHPGAAGQARDAAGSAAVANPGQAHDPCLRPCFSSPRVAALMSTREGGSGQGAYASFNLRPGIGDDEAAVAANRARWAAMLGVAIRRLDQVHGAQVAVFDAAPPAGGSVSEDLPQADASCTSLAGLACEVQVADCLPVLFADRLGRAVAAAHAGWRGLAGGVLAATLDALQQQAGLEPRDIEAWLGPCIGPRAFEVGGEVREAFLVRPGGPVDPQPVSRRFAPAAAPGKWFADLAGLARDELIRLQVGRVFGNDGAPSWCTVHNPSRFFSFRRDRVTGRMAAAVWLREG